MPDEYDPFATGSTRPTSDADSGADVGLRTTVSLWRQGEPFDPEFDAAIECARGGYTMDCAGRQLDQAAYILTLYAIAEGQLAPDWRPMLCKAIDARIAELQEMRERIAAPSRARGAAWARNGGRHV